MRVHGDLVEAGIEVLTSDPTGFEGRVYYNSADDEFKIYTSGSWKIIAQGNFEIDLRNTPNDGDIFVFSSGSNRWVHTARGNLIFGAASSTDNALIRWDGTDGEDTQNSLVIVDDSGNLTTPGQINGVSPIALSRIGGVTSNVQTQIDGKEDTITAGTTAQYYRGDKTFQTLNATAVGLGNVNNTSDANKPVSTAQQTEIDTKQDDVVTNRGDIIRGGSSGDAERLAVGTSGQVLTSDGTDVSWENAPSGFADPMTTRGDIIYKDSGGTTTRLPAGTSGQVLTSDGTDISWEDASGGGGSGDVVGPASSTDNTLPRYDGTTGKLLQGSGATLDDSGNLTTTGDVNGASPTEMGYLAGTSSAIQTQIDAKQAEIVTTRGDIIYGNASGDAARLPLGTSGQVLTSDGTDLSWDNAASGFADPMTTRGDIIYKDSGGTTTRLAAGTSGQVLTSDGTDISWEDAAGGGGSSDTITSGTTASSDGRDGAVYLSPANIGADNGTGGNIMVDSTRYSSAIGYQNIDMVFHPNVNLPIKNSSTNRAVAIGGADNRVGNNNALVIGGGGNDNDGEYAAICGGRNNDLGSSSNYGFIGGGDDVVVSGSHSGHIGGLNVTTSTDYGGSVGGRDITLSGAPDYSFTGGGRVVTVTGQYSGVVGSRDISLQGNYSFVVGYDLTTIGEHIIMFGEDGYSTTAHTFNLAGGPSIATEADRDENITYRAWMETGLVEIGRHIDQDTTGITGDVNELRLQTLNANNQSNYFGWKASESMTTSYVAVAPLAIAASVGQVLQVESISGSEAILNWSSQLWVPHNDAGNSGTSLDVDFDDGNVQTVTLTGNVTFTFSNPKAGAAYTLILKQDGTGSRTVTWPAAVKWPGGTAPTITTAASSIDVVTIIYDGTDYLGGFNQDYS